MEKNGVSAIIYDDMGEKYFLILHRISGWQGWEFPKGGINEGETPEQALVREINEEVALNRYEVKGRLEEGRVFMEGDIKHNIMVYLVQANMNTPVTIDKKEHDTYLWATKERVLEKLTWPEEKEAFKRVLQAIKN